MKFECGDLERALAVSDLMPEAREHLKQCAACRREYRLWNEISTQARGLHEEWESPELWPKIRTALEAEPKRRVNPGWRRSGAVWALAASLAIVAGLGMWQWTRQAKVAHEAAGEARGSGAMAVAGNRYFLTEQALKDVETTESAYRQSIEKLSQLAAPELENPRTAKVVNDKEKLLMLDSAIRETRANLDHNQFNMRLQTDLAALYREKQQTLREVLTRDEKN